MAGKIFISYRRDDDPGFARALYQRLEQEFPRENVFMDVEGHIKPGDDFREVLTSWVAASDVFLAVIGPRWADVMLKRAGDPDDFVTIEIQAALDQRKRVIPVLVGGASMPQVGSLPEPIRDLASRQSLDLRPDQFPRDCQGLVAELKRFIEQSRKAQIAPVDEGAGQPRPQAWPTHKGEIGSVGIVGPQQRPDDIWELVGLAVGVGLVLGLPLILWAGLGREWGTVSLIVVGAGTVLLLFLSFGDDFAVTTVILAVLVGQVITLTGLHYESMGVALLGVATGVPLAVGLYRLLSD
jgi:hypothetical protein